MAYGIRCWDLSGNPIVDITTSLSNILNVVTIPKDTIGSVSGNASNPLPRNSRFFYAVVGNNVPLNALGWAASGNRRVNVAAFKITISILGDGTFNWSATNQWGQNLGLPSDVLIYFGCY